MRVDALILSGGTGTRMGADCPKQFLMLGGIPVLARTVEAFCSHPDISRVLVVSGASFLLKTQTVLKTIHSQKLLAPVTGGKTRQESSYLGLCALEQQEEPPDYVLIHDAARPLVSDAVISRCVRDVVSLGACTASIPVQDTIVLSDAPPLLASVPDRNTLFAVQTPQAFSFAQILSAHRALCADAVVTDDTSVMRLAGYPVYLTEGEKRNIKLTTKEDFLIAEAFLSCEQNTHS